MTDIQFEFEDDTPPGLYAGPVLVKRDSVGRLRTWQMQITGEGHYRTLSGLKDGKQAVSGWTIPVPASQPTVKDQGEFEVRAQYRHQLEREYRRTEAELETSQDEFVEPMLAKAYDKFPGAGYSQPKLDGIRCIARASGLFSRQGQPIIAVPHIHAALQPLFDADPGLILDGELYNHDLREDFGAISSIVRKQKPTVEQLEQAEAVMQYHVYDMPSSTANFGDRSRELVRLLAPIQGDWLQIVPTRLSLTATDADEAYEEFIGLGYEGGMFRLDAPYERGRRSKSLLKRKDFLTEEFRVLRIEEGKGNWAGAAKRMELQNNIEAATFGAGIRGSYPSLKEMLESFGPGAHLPTSAVATVRFFCRSPDGVPRFPVVIDFHPNGRKD